MTAGEGCVTCDRARVIEERVIAEYERRKLGNEEKRPERLKLSGVLAPEFIHPLGTR